MLRVAGTHFTFSKCKHISTSIFWLKALCLNQCYWCQRWYSNATELPTLLRTWTKCPFPHEDFCIILSLRTWTPRMADGFNLIPWSLARLLFEKNSEADFRFRGKGYSDWLVMSVMNMGEGWEDIRAMHLPSLIKQRRLKAWPPPSGWGWGPFLKMLPFWPAAETWTAVYLSGHVSGFWLFVF